MLILEGETYGIHRIKSDAVIHVEAPRIKFLSMFTQCICCFEIHCTKLTGIPKILTNCMVKLKNKTSLPEYKIKSLLSICNVSLGIELVGAFCNFVGAVVSDITHSFLVACAVEVFFATQALKVNLV